MSNQIKPSVTTPTIADIYHNIESDKLILQPDFQRKFVWTHEHQEEFIDTILNGFPFPEIYVCQGDIDLKKMKTTQNVIDGQQRLTTIKKYIDSSFEKELKKIPSFENLNDDQRENFLSYQIVFRDIGKVSDDIIREVFRRINLTKFQLENVEIHNAVYDGYFIQTGKDIIGNISLEKYGVFYESEFTRMADLHFILLIMATLENDGYFPRDNEVENFIAKFNDEYPNKDHIKPLLLKTFAIISDLDLPLDSIWLRKSNFFTLVVELAKNIEKLEVDIKDKLISFEKSIIENKTDSSNEYGMYYSYMYSGTASRKARVERGLIFKKHVID